MLSESCYDTNKILARTTDGARIAHIARNATIQSLQHRFACGIADLTGSQGRTEGLTEEAVQGNHRRQDNRCKSDHPDQHVVLRI